MSMSSPFTRPSTQRAARLSTTGRLHFRQFVGLIVLFAALSAGTMFAQAGWEKWNDAAWTGPHAGLAMKGFLAGATFKATVTKTNPFPDVLPVWNSLNHHLIAQHLQLFGWLVVLGELLIPLGVVTLLCVRFPGSRALLVGVSLLAVGLNLLYLHEGSAGDNTPMLLLWLTVLLTAIVFPEAAQAYAIDLAPVVHRAQPRQSPATRAPRQRWIAAAALLVVLGLESLLLHSAGAILLLGGITLALAVALHTLNQAVAAVAWHAPRTERGPVLSGARLDVE